MKTVITIENGQVEVRVDDEAPVLVKPTLPKNPVSSKPGFTSVIPKAREFVARPKATREVTCIICGKVFDTSAKRATTCSVKCREERNRRYAKEYANRNRKFGFVPRSSGPVQSKPTGIPETVIRAVPAPSAPAPTFTDEFNCWSCQERKQLCNLHKAMKAKRDASLINRMPLTEGSHENSISRTA